MKPYLKALVQIGIGLMAFMPTFIFLLIKALLDPTGFWQNLFTFGIGVWLLGGLQIITFFLGVMVSFILWSE